MVHDGRPNSPLATLPHAFDMRSEILSWSLLNTPKPKPFWTLSRRRSTQARVFFGVVSALAAYLDLAVTPFLGEPRETGFEWPTAGVMVDECGVDAERVANPERLEVQFEGVTDENGSEAVLGAR